MLPWILVAPAVVLLVAVVAGVLRYRVRVEVTGRQTVGRGPLAVIYAGMPEDDAHDQFEFTAVNRSLQAAIFVREFGAIGLGTDGQEVRVRGDYSTQPIRLERNQGRPWTTSFPGLAANGIDLERGVRGYAIITGRETPFRSRALTPRPSGSRAIPRPSPVTRSRS